MVSPTVIASDATTKNQPPDIDIIVFQIRPGAANGTSNRQNRSHGESWKCWQHFVEIGRNRAQRLVEAERHVPGLGGEDREDRRALGAELVAGKQPQEEGDRERQKAEHRNRLKDVERRDDDELGFAALGRQRRDHEGKQQRQEDRREHAQRGAQRIFGQIARVERDWRDIEPFERRAHLVRAMGNRRECAGDQNEHDEVVEVRQEPARSEPQR